MDRNRNFFIARR